MCLGIPARIVELTDHPHLVRAEIFGADREINVGLIEEGVEPGEWVMIHVGFAISKLDDSEVEQAKASLRMLGSEAEDDGLGAFEAELFSVWEKAETTQEVEQWA